MRKILLVLFFQLSSVVAGNQARAQSLQCSKVLQSSTEQHQFELTGYSHHTQLERVSFGANGRAYFKGIYTPVDINAACDDGYLCTAIHSDLSRLMTVANGLATVHSSYGNHLSDSEKEMVRNSDNSQLFESFQSPGVAFASVTTASGPWQKTVGYLRVSTDSGQRLPFENLLLKKNIQTEVIHQWKQDFDELHELGRYYLDPDLNPTALRQVRGELYRWLIRNFLSADDATLTKKLFIIDVGDIGLSRMYRMLLGAELVDKGLFNPPLSEIDAILTVDGLTLKNKLLKLI